MEHLKNQLTRLAERLQLTNSENEQDQYILTAEEEKIAIQNEIQQKKNYAEWKMKGLKLPQAEIDVRLKETNWEEKINRQEVLQRVNSNKIQDLWHQEQREKEKEMEKKVQQELVEQWTAKNMYRLMQWTSRNTFGKDLIVNEANKPFITALCFFVSRDPRFETELGYSLKKGLLVRGASGLGKTHLVRCLERNELNPILVLSMIEIADQVKAEGEYQIHRGNTKLLYLDDVGTEEATVNHYGTKINFFKNFIEMYYLRNLPANQLLFSTNNSFSEIEEKYGFRVRSRLKDMFNVIDVAGKDMRG